MIKMFNMKYRIVDNFLIKDPLLLSVYVIKLMEIMLIYNGSHLVY